ncbi:hypothetical protein [Aliivibrio fischeri]|uniref:hypothetical protein n=1 Tax=Aliivibrio fischeri TaxID=668 RepID=UPI00080E2BCA|nr:hypothetical protein [Aliivibrio fischeri]OCH37526.1 hypothetical protein A6D99_13765 [Aliivibrio fischeri]
MKKISVVTFVNSSFSSINYNLSECDDIALLEVEKRVSSIFKTLFHLLKTHKRLDYVIVNYVTLYYIFGFILTFLGVKTIFIPHEGEPLFPKELHSNIIGVRRLLAKKKHTQRCIDNSFSTLFLSNLQQKEFKSKNSSVIHIGSNADFFYNRFSWDERNGILFPSRKNEKIKGYDIISSLDYLLINKDGVYSQEEIAIAYAKAKIVVIPSIIESYSFSMIEAMLSNCIIVTSINVGLANDLLLEHSIEKLEGLGIYILDDINDINEFILNKFFIGNAIIHEPKTRKFALDIGLNAKYIPIKLKQIIHELE